MKISKIMEKPSIRILLFLHEEEEVRYTELTDLIASRGTLSLNMKELDEEELIKRKVVTSKPIQTHYSLTERGKEVARRLKEIKQSLT